MLVSESELVGTIGGGELENSALLEARAALRTANSRPRRWRRKIALGPSLGQCCGGSVELFFERFETGDVGDAAYYLRPASGDASGHWIEEFELDLGGGPHIFDQQGEIWVAEAVRPSALRPLFLYGAGHVGRAVVKALLPLPFDLHWIDVEDGRFPLSDSARVARILAKQPEIIARNAPENAVHLVMTYSHQLDLLICDAVLGGRGFSHLGLIGSATKKHRFLKRLTELGHGEEVLSRLSCPIGVPGIESKHPAAIAASVAAEMLQIEEMLQKSATEFVSDSIKAMTTRTAGGD